MGDKNYGDPVFAVEPLENSQDLHAGPRVQIPRRLVRQQDRGLVDQGTGDGHSLLLSS